MQTGRIRWLAFREWQGINTRATRTTTKRWGPCRSSLQLQRGARVGGGIPQRAQGLATIWWLLRVVLMVVAQASSDYFAFRISCQLHSGQDTHLVSGVNQRQWKAKVSARLSVVSRIRPATSISFRWYRIARILFRSRILTSRSHSSLSSAATVVVDSPKLRMRYIRESC